MSSVLTSYLRGTKLISNEKAVIIFEAENAEFDAAVATAVYSCQEINKYQEYYSLFLNIGKLTKSSIQHKLLPSQYLIEFNLGDSQSEIYPRFLSLLNKIHENHQGKLISLVISGFEKLEQVLEEITMQNIFQKGFAKYSEFRNIFFLTRSDCISRNLEVTLKHLANFVFSIKNVCWGDENLSYEGCAWTTETIGYSKREMFSVDINKKKEELMLVVDKLGKKTQKNSNESSLPKFNTTFNLETTDAQRKAKELADMNLPHYAMQKLSGEEILAKNDIYEKDPEQDSDDDFDVQFLF